MFRNKDKSTGEVSNKNLGNESEQSRRSGQGSMGSSSGRNSGSMDQGSEYRGGGGRSSGSSGAGSRSDISPTGSDISKEERQSRH